MNVISIALLLLVVSYSSATCSDGSRFPDDKTITCCRTKSRFSRCPLKNAVCCNSGTYCCPAGMTCNLKDGTCIHHLTGTQNTTRSLTNINDHACPDRVHKCSDDATCCLISPSDYGCCPFKQAVCCSDREHCCPPETVCNLQEARCDRVLIATVPNVKIFCPGGEFVCPEGDTCCLMKGGQYGCCPVENAVCCPDKQHCCPSGYKCTPSACKKNNETLAKWIGFN